MRRVLLALTLAMAGLTYGHGGANAQSSYAPDRDYEFDTYKPADADGGTKPRTRVYGYYQEAPGFDRYQDRGYSSEGCGTYFYWNGYACVDARNK